MTESRLVATRVAWAALVVAAALLPMLALVVTGHQVGWGDTAAMFAPLRPAIVDALRDGRLPLWNPHEGFGIPLFAQIQHGVLHPVSLLAAFLFPGASVDLLAAAHVALAALGAALLARELGASRGAATAAGAGFGLSGYVLGMSVNLPFLAGAGAAPWVVLALRRAGRLGGRWIAGAALAFACAAFAGEPQWAIVAVALGGVLAMEAAGIRGLARAVSGTLLGAAIAAVQLLPTWHFLQQTDRAAALSLDVRSRWSLTPWRLLELVAPGLPGEAGARLGDPVYVQLLRSDDVVTFPFVPSVFVGAALLALALTGARASRTSRAIAAAAALFLWMALGTLAGADQLLHRIPIWGAFRYPEKLIGPFVLCVAVLGALGVDRVRAAPSRNFAVGTGIAAACAAAAALGFAAWGPRLVPGDAAELAADRLAIGFGHAAFALAALAALVAAARRGERVKVSFASAAAGLVLLSSYAAAPFALHAGDPRAREAAPLRELATPGSVVRVATPLLAIWLPAVPTRWGPASLDEFDRALALDSRMGAPAHSSASGIDNVRPYTAMYPRRLARLHTALADAFSGGAYRALRRYGVTHVAIRDPVSEEELAFGSSAIEGGTRIRSDPAWGVSVWQVPHRPWADFARGVVPAASEDEALRAVVGAAASGSDGVVVEAALPPAAATGRVHAIERSREHLRIEAEAEGDALLVVNDTWWPGWEATLDGRPVPILRADFVVRAVQWPAGRHVLEMRYRPAEVAIGAWITAFGLAALAGVVLAPAARKLARSPQAAVRDPAPDATAPR